MHITPIDSYQPIDHHSIRTTSWLNYLTAQSIPEETDSIDDCSVSSMEDSYIILNDQQSLSVNEKELHYAEINEDHVEYDQFTQSMILEVK